MHRLTVLTVLLLGVGAARGADADKPQAVFDELYGPRLKQALSTTDFADDLELAQELIASAGSVNGSPGLTAIMYDKAYTLASRSPAGYDAAASALEKLAEQQPDRKADCYDKLINLRQRQYSQARGDERKAAGEALVSALVSMADGQEKEENLDAASSSLRRASAVASAIGSAQADALKSHLLSLAQRQRTLAQIAQLKDKLKDGPNEALAKDLITLCIVDLDDPQEARKYTFLTQDAALKDAVAMAGKPVDAIETDQMLTMGDWYRDLAKAAAPSSQAPMLRHAVAYYQQFLKVHTAQDIQTSRATLALGAATKALEQATATPGGDNSGPASTIDMLTLVDPNRHALLGQWSKDGKVLMSKTAGQAVLRIPVQPRGDYRVDWEVQPADNPAFGLMMPVGDTAVILFMNRKGERAGLDLIANEGWERNKTFGFRQVPNRDQPLHISVQVRISGKNVTIESTINGQPFVQWAGPVDALSLPPVWKAEAPITFRLITNGTQIAVSTLKLTMIHGSARKFD